MNTIGYFEIQSSDPRREIKFYETVFGWKFIKQEFVPIEYYRIETNSIYDRLLKRTAKVPPPESGTNAYVCSVQIENLTGQVKSYFKMADRSLYQNLLFTAGAGRDISLTLIITHLEYLKLMKKQNNKGKSLQKCLNNKKN